LPRRRWRFLSVLLLCRVGRGGGFLELLFLALQIVVEFLLILLFVLIFLISPAILINLIVRVFVTGSRLLLYVPGSKMFM
jgi:hypothetical protein